jgi:exodeoxyribonuclease VII large subunit
MYLQRYHRGVERLPFDPEHARGPEPAGKGRSYASIAEADVLSVSQLAGIIQRTLERQIASPLRVVGEISNLSNRNHWYFSLKDEGAVVQCVAWASTARRFGFEPRDGDQVVATGHVSHYPAQGRTQLYVSALAPVGAGELERRFRAMCDELRGLGYFEEERKKPLPAFPRRIAVITSADGAALHDVVATAAERWRAVGLLVVDVRVQGEGAARQVASAIRRVDREREMLGIDAILVTRGGGSLEDLWAFNERVVADAVHRCHLPVVAAIGHESDTTVIELVADVRAATPTQAVMRMIPATDALERQLNHARDRLRLLTRRRLESARQRLDRIRDNEIFRRPAAVLRRARERLEHLDRHLRRGSHGRIFEERAALDRLCQRWAQEHPAAIVASGAERLAQLQQRLHHGARLLLEQGPRLAALQRALELGAARSLERSRQRVGSLDVRLRALDPEHVLRRGFSYTTAADGTLVQTVTAVEAGDELVTHVADGTIRSSVRSSRRAKRSRKAASTSGRGGRSRGRQQMDLFGGKQ